MSTPNDKLDKKLDDIKSSIKDLSAPGTSVRYMSQVLKWTIFASSALLFFALGFQSTAQDEQSPVFDAVKDILPFATGLIGFAGGLVTAMFGKTATPKETPPPGTTTTTTTP